MLVFVLRLILALIFGTAAIAKFADVTGFRRTLESLGIRNKMTSILVRVIPALELAIAVALLTSTSMVPGAVAAVALLAVFTATAAWVTFSGRQVECRCFGRIGRSRIGRATVLRNAFFLLLAVAVVWLGREETGPTLTTVALTPEWAHVLLMLNLVGLATCGMLGVLLWRQQGRILLQVEKLENRPAPPAPPTKPPVAGLPVGTLVPPATLTDALGRSLELGDLLVGARPVMLLFVEAGCGHCRTLLPWIERWAAEMRSRVRVDVVTRAPDRATIRKALGGDVVEVFAEQDHAVSTALRVEVVPSALVIRANGRIGSRIAVGAPAIRTLLDSQFGEVGAAGKATGAQPAKSLTVGRADPVAADAR